MHILTDNQALVKALAGIETGCTTIEETRSSLNNASRTNSITIHWIKAHNNFYGNELADQLAKDGAMGLGTGPYIQVPLSKTVARTEVFNSISDLWNKRWQAEKSCRQTKIFFPEINRSKSAKIKSSNRTTLSRLVRGITGHDFRRRHEGLIEGVSRGNCRFCEEEEESSDHIINHCPRLTVLRSDTFGTLRGFPVTPNWQPEQLAAFLSDPTISGMEAPEREY